MNENNSVLLHVIVIMCTVLILSITAGVIVVGDHIDATNYIEVIDTGVLYDRDDYVDEDLAANKAMVMPVAIEITEDAMDTVIETITETESESETETVTELEEDLSKDLYDEEQLKREHDDSMILLLAVLIRAEAGNQPYDGKRLVADVVLNRVDNPEFPNSIDDVIFQEGQFAVVPLGMLEEAWNTYDESDLNAARQEYYGPRLDSGVLYFATYKANGVGFYKVGDHWFSY